MFVKTVNLLCRGMEIKKKISLGEIRDLKDVALRHLFWNEMLAIS